MDYIPNALNDIKSVSEIKIYGHPKVLYIKSTHQLITFDGETFQKQCGIKQLKIINEQTNGKK